MQATGTTPKKYKKIILTGLRIPPPPPSLTTLTSQQSTQTQTQTTQNLKQQSIQKSSSSSSDDQSFYESYFHNKLVSIIKELLGQGVDHEILELRESNAEEEIGKKEGESVVDVVLKISVVEEKVGELKDKIGSMKKDSNTKNRQSGPKKSTKSSPKKSKPANSTAKNKKISPIKKQARSASPTPSNSSEQQQPNTEEASSRNLNFIQQTTQNIQQTDHDLSSMVILNHKINRNDLNRERKNNSNKKQSKSVKNQKESSSEEQADSDRKRNKSNSREAKKFRKFCISLVVGLLILATLAATILFITREVEQQLQQNQTQQKIPAPPPPLNLDQATQHFNQQPYLGQIGTKFKKIHFSAASKQDQSSHHPIYIQTIPAVSFPQHSLHPNNYSYLRPSSIKLLTFDDINIKDQYKLRNNKRILNFTHSEEEIKKYLNSLGKNNKTIMSALYTQLHKDPNSTLLLEAQYLYLSKKYSLPTVYLRQKPFCIVAYGQNLYQSNKFIPFFQSLFNQNYTKYRLVYIDNASQDEYNSVKIMNYLWTNFHEKLGTIGTNNFYFAKLDKKLSKSLAKFSIIRQTCGEGDIVIDMDADSQFVGRQALGVVSSVYDGGSQRFLSIPKADLDMYLNPIKYGQKNLQKQTDGKQSKSEDQPIQPQQQQPFKKKDITAKQERVFVSRKIMYIWSAYANYLYSEASQNNDVEKISYKFVNSSEQVMRMKEISRMDSNFEDVRKNIGMKFLSNVCLKTYVSPLHMKIPFTKLTPKFSGNAYHESYLYDIQLLMSVLEISGKFTQKVLKAKQPQNFVEIQQPLCYRSNANLLSKCEEIKMLYEELHLIGRSELSLLSGDIMEQKSYSAQKFNKKKENPVFQKYLEQIKAQMLDACRS